MAPLSKHLELRRLFVAESVKDDAKGAVFSPLNSTNTWCDFDPLNEVATVAVCRPHQDNAHVCWNKEWNCSGTKWDPNRYNKSFVYKHSEQHTQFNVVLHGDVKLFYDNKSIKTRLCYSISYWWQRSVINGNTNRGRFEKDPDFRM